MCAGRARAIIAASLLKGAGYPDVSILDGGTTAWTEHGFGLETGMPQEIDFGQPVWMARLLQGLPAGVQPEPLPGSWAGSGSGWSRTPLTTSLAGQAICR